MFFLFLGLSSHFIKLFIYYFMCAFECLHEFMYTTCMQKSEEPLEVVGTPELELQASESSHHVDDGNETQVLCKSTKLSLQEISPAFFIFKIKASPVSMTTLRGEISEAPTPRVTGN